MSLQKNITDGLGYFGGTRQLVEWAGVPFPSPHLFNDDDYERTKEEGRIDAARAAAASARQGR